MHVKVVILLTSLLKKINAQAEWLTNRFYGGIFTAA